MGMTGSLAHAGIVHSSTFAHQGLHIVILTKTDTETSPYLRTAMITFVIRRNVDCRFLTWCINLFAHHLLYLLSSPIRTTRMGTVML